MTVPNSFPILTPPAPPTPQINGARVLGARPGSPFLFHVPVTGAPPIQYAADGLPAGLHLNQATGDITGVLLDEGTHDVRLRAANEFGAVEKGLTIVAGERIALTPPMGWNSWNCCGGQVSEAKVLAAARAMVALGLREHGWSYVNIDDGWQGARGGPFNAIQPNAKFPNLRGLADNVHSLGLKFGIYSTPWRASFYAHIGSSADDAEGGYDWVKAGGQTDFGRYAYPQGRSRLEGQAWLAPLGRRLTRRRIRRINRNLRRFGRFSLVAQDVRQWAEWGVDFLKYDWVPIDLPHADEVRQALRGCGRDIVLSLSNNASLSLALALAEGAELWRTSCDVLDDWSQIERVGFSRDAWAPFQGPGHYNDPDMLVLGEVGWDSPRPTRLSADEQYAHMSLWCLLGAPLLLGCDLEKIDPFTLGLITNDEVLEVNQDPLCRQATSFAGGSIFAKPLQSGGLAVGLFNPAKAPGTVRVSWRDLGLSRPQTVRDLWRQQDLGEFTSGFESAVAPHGVRLLRVSSARESVV